jgi:tetratricopeptide (TPR) repeat protein
VNEPGPVARDGSELTRPVFISYATADRKEALSVCKAIERRGTQCWISTRDVAPGENYQEAIVRSLRNARAMVLVFSDAANNSDEIKTELSLASRYHIPVMALRIEDVEPSDAFAYELSTRQWIDAFGNWDKSVDALVQQIRATSLQASEPIASPSPGARTRIPVKTASRRNLFIAAAAVMLVALLAGGWWLLRPMPSAAHSMMVRLTGFSNLSGDLPGGMPDAVRDEIMAAFNDDGVVGVSTAAAPPAGTAPAYALGGTIRRDGDKIKVNVRVINERSGAALWSNIFSYDADQLSRVPRHVAVDAGNMVRCGLFGASTYPKALSDTVLADYFLACHNSGIVESQPGKELDAAMKVVAAAPDFSWGWASVSEGALELFFDNPKGPRAAEYRKQAMDAADKAIALDKSNSQALDLKGFLQDPRDLVAQESLYKQALDARPLACGCEHHIYGGFLQNVGRLSEATDEYRRSTDVLALNPSSQAALADVLLQQGKADEAKAPIDATIDLLSDPAAKDRVALYASTSTGDYGAAVKAISNPQLKLPAPLKTALGAGFGAMVSGDAEAKARAVQALVALPPEMKRRFTATLLGALGANREALQVVALGVDRQYFDTTSWLWVPSMAGAIRDPSFPALAQQFGLMRFWKTSHTKPDVCSAKDPPPFCRMI